MTANPAPTTAQLYDLAADNWQRGEPVLLSDFTARPFLLDWCEPILDSTVLDLGCGEGYVSRQLRQRGAESVHGIDISAEMIARAMDQEARQPMGITFEHGNATDLSPFETASMDLVVAVFLFNYLDRRQMTNVLCAAHRVLRPGGTLVFSVPHPSLPFLRDEAPPFYFRTGPRGYFSGQDVLMEGKIWRRDGSSVPVRCVHKTVEDYFVALKDAGFTSLPDIQELRVTEAHLALDRTFFGPLQDQPLHLALRIRKAERQ